jgi:beta-glucosidase/6-phospho-beta-glucosidase/beta-galactosidase
MVFALVTAAGVGAPAEVEKISFPSAFAFGTATAAYQIEGAHQEGGRGLSIWDAFTHAPGKVRTGETGDVAADHYHHWKSDVRLMAQMKLRYYRFSISWSRVLPNGHGAVNEEGVRFYNGLIDELIANVWRAQDQTFSCQPRTGPSRVWCRRAPRCEQGIHPVATLYHWDLPLTLQMEFDGWLSEMTASAYVQYAVLCFARFGDRVKHWITFNEPANHAVYGFARGEHAPGRSRRQTREPYVAAHYMLLAHAYAVARYRSEFQPQQRGLISIALNSDWREPATDAPADIAAAQRSMEFNLGWFADPLFTGDYPPSMRQRVGSRLPAFTPAQQRLLINSTDFFALQHYSTLLVSMRPDGELDQSSFYADEGVRYHPTPGARKNVLGWDVAPFGFHRLLKWVSSRYKPSGGIVVTENGLPLFEEAPHAARRDLQRVCYIK